MKEWIHYVKLFTLNGTLKRLKSLNFVHKTSAMFEMQDARKQPPYLTSPGRFLTQTTAAPISLQPDWVGSRPAEYVVRDWDADTAAAGHPPPVPVSEACRGSRHGDVASLWIRRETAAEFPGVSGPGCGPVSPECSPGIPVDQPGRGSATGLEWVKTDHLYTTADCENIQTHDESLLYKVILILSYSYYWVIQS